MRQSNEYINAVVKSINAISLRYGGEKVFRDWCELYALSLANGCDLLHGETWQRRENRYLAIIKPYAEDSMVDALVKMCADLVMAFETDPFQDHLGCIYMELFGGNKNLGQCFTPIDVCRVCGQLTLNDLPTEPEHYPITINDCACGGGAMLIAACKTYQERGFDWQRKVKFYANDLDSLCVHMCYIQLSLLGCRAIVKQQDTITQEVFDTFITPMEILWPSTLGLESPKEPHPVRSPLTDSKQVVNIEILIGG